MRLPSFSPAAQSNAAGLRPSTRRQTGDKPGDKPSRRQTFKPFTVSGHPHDISGFWQPSLFATINIARKSTAHQIKLLIASMHSGRLEASKYLHFSSGYPFGVVV